jgi:hypothetical protein
MAQRRKQQARDWALSPWDQPPYREIEKKIGEGLRELYKPPQEFPPYLLVLLARMDN